MVSKKRNRRTLRRRVTQNKSTSYFSKLNTRLEHKLSFLSACNQASNIKRSPFLLAHKRPIRPADMVTIRVCALDTLS